MPLEELIVEFDCPHCNRKLPIALQQVLDEEMVTCPHCQASFQLIAEANAPAARRALKDFERQWEQVRKTLKKRSR